MAKWTLIQKSKEANIFQTAGGKKVVKLTPSGKMKRYDREIKSGMNSRTGKPLNDVAVGYRMGYRAALGEQAAIFKKKRR